MRENTAVREKAIKQLRKKFGRKDSFGYPGRYKEFPKRVKKEIQWIEENKILGTWGKKGEDIQYDKRIFADRCRSVREEKEYSQEEVAKNLLLKTHAYISELERGEKRVSITILEALSLLYRKEPKYLLGLEDAPLESATYCDDRYVDHCEYFILNSLFSPQLFALSPEVIKSKRLKYTNAVTKLSKLPDSTARDLMDILKMIPSLKEITDLSIFDGHGHNAELCTDRHPFSQWDQLITQYKDDQERAELNNARVETLSASETLCDRNPTWLILISRIIKTKPEWIFCILYIAENGGYTPIKARKNLSTQS